ncbi:MAG: hypothetical protein M3081_06840, partial [Gemmatimonadota bacterium]|nr:hypothetical protein [Gemmatimonadota bacterium]
AHVLRDGRSVQVDLESAMTGSATGRIVLFSNDVLIVPASNGFFTRENVTTLLGATTAILSVVNLVIALRR